MSRRIEPYRIKAVEPIPLTTREEREDALAEADFNLFRLPSSKVTVDLLTDSGVSAMSARQWSAIMDADESYAGARSFERLQSAVRRLTGMTHVIPAHQGRAAERLLLEAVVRPGDVVPGNMHFDTTRGNIERLGAMAVDLPVPAALSPGTEGPFKGNLDVSALEALLERAPAVRPPLVIVTVTSNGCGGQPVSMENLRHVRAVCDVHGIPLFLDAARFAENAWLIREREDGWQETPPRAIARSMFSLADGCVMSGKKDALVNIGGFIALRDRAVAERIRQSMVVTEGFPTYGGLAGRDMEAMAVGLEEVLDPGYLEDRIAQVREMAVRLDAAGVPIVRPAGGHAVYLDSRAFAPHLDPLDLPGHGIACALYLEAGVRSCEVGQLMKGRAEGGAAEAPVELDLVRLAIPRRVYTSAQLAYAADAVIRVFAAAPDLRPYTILEQPAALRHFTARLRPRALAPRAVRRPVNALETAR